MKEHEEKYPGMAKHGCSSPYRDFKMMSKKCNECPRYTKCWKEAPLEMMEHGESEYRKKKRSKPKTKKCGCK